MSAVQWDEEGWTEIGGGDGSLTWPDTDDGADDRGVLACVVPVRAPGDDVVRCADSPATVRAAAPFVVAVLLGVGADDRPRVTWLGG